MSILTKNQTAVPALDKQGSNVLCPQEQALRSKMAILGSVNALAYQGASRIMATGTAESQGTRQNDASSNLNTAQTQNNESETMNTSGSRPRSENHIKTMEPATAGEIRAFNNRNRNNRNRQQRQRQAAQSYNEEVNSIRNYDKFYSIQFPGAPLDKSNPIAIERDLKNKAGSFADRVRKQNKNTLLVKVVNQHQGATVKEIKEIAGYPVEIRPHNSLNQSKGTLYSETMSSCTIEELEEVLHPQGVTKIERMSRKFDGVLTPTHRYIITFDKPELPQSIKLSDWHYELIELYIPTPMQCVKCQKLGHTQKWCRREVAICARCSQEGHQARTCINDPKCANCGGSHKSMDRKCPLYIFKSEVLATQARVKCLYHEAESEVKDRYREEGKTYSFVVRRQMLQNAEEPRDTPEEDGQAAISPSGPNITSFTSMSQPQTPFQNTPSASSPSDSDKEEEKKEEEEEQEDEEEEKKEEEKKEEEEDQEEEEEEEERRRRSEERSFDTSLAEAQGGLIAEAQSIVEMETPSSMNEPRSTPSQVSDPCSKANSDEEDSQIKNQKEQGAMPKNTSNNDAKSDLFFRAARNAVKGKHRPPIFEDIRTRNKFDSLPDEQEPPSIESKHNKQSKNSADKKIEETSNKQHARKPIDLFVPSYLSKKRKNDELRGSNSNLEASLAKKQHTFSIPVIGSSSGHKPSDVKKSTKPSAKWR